MDNLKKKILDNINIVDVVNSYIPLEKNGQNYKCVCPFHEDTNPSLVVSPQKQIFKCFVCNTGGNAIDFVKDYEKISFNKAQEKLAQQANIKIKSSTIKNQQYYDILNDINTFYTKILNNSKLGHKALEYLKENRNLTDEEIAKFNIGFSPKFSTALNEYINLNEHNGVKIEELKIFNDKNYDLLQGRITIPIYDQYDNLVAFSGRALDEEQDIKYLNSKESILFNKSQTLYNFNNVIGLKTNELLIVEGYFDVITAFKNKIENVVGTMGTAFNQSHINLLKKYNFSKVYLGFDNDNAGDKATAIAVELLTKNNIEVSILNYGSQKDIDEYFNNNQNLTWIDLKSKSKNYILYLLDANEHITDIDQKSEFINKLSNILSTYQDITKREMLIEQICQRLNIKRIVLDNQIKNQTIKQKPIKNINIQKVIDDENKLTEEDLIFYIMTCANEHYKYVENKIKANEFEFIKNLEDYNTLKELYNKKETFDEIDLLDNLENYDNIKNNIKNKYGLNNFKSCINEIMISDLIYSKKKDKIKKQSKIFNI